MDISNTNNRTSSFSNNTNNVSQNSPNRFPVLRFLRVVWLLYIIVLINKFFPSEYGNNVTAWLNQYYNKQTPRMPQENSSTQPTTCQERDSDIVNAEEVPPTTDITPTDSDLSASIANIQTHDATFVKNTEQESQSTNEANSQEDQATLKNDDNNSTHATIHNLSSAHSSQIESTISGQQESQSVNETNSQEDQATLENDDSNSIQATPHNESSVHSSQIESTISGQQNVAEENTTVLELNQTEIKNVDDDSIQHVNNPSNQAQATTTDESTTASDTSNKPTTLDARLESWTPFNDMKRSKAWTAINDASILENADDTISINGKLDGQIDQLHQDILKSMQDTEDLYTDILKRANMNVEQKSLERLFANIRNTSPNISIQKHILPADYSDLSWPAKDELIKLSLLLIKKSKIKKYDLMNTILHAVSGMRRKVPQYDFSPYVNKISNALTMQVTLLAHIKAYQQYTKDLYKLQQHLDLIHIPDVTEFKQALADPDSYKQYIGRHAVSLGRFITQPHMERQMALEDNLRQGFLLGLKQLSSQIQSTQDSELSTSPYPAKHARTEDLKKHLAATNAPTLARQDSLYILAFNNVAKIAEIYFSKDPEFKTAKLEYLRNIIDTLPLASNANDETIVTMVNKTIADIFDALLNTNPRGIEMSEQEHEMIAKLCANISKDIVADHRIMSTQDMNAIRQMTRNT